MNKRCTSRRCLRVALTLPACSGESRLSPAVSFVAPYPRPHTTGGGHRAALWVCVFRQRGRRGRHLRHPRLRAQEAHGVCVSAEPATAAPAAVAAAAACGGSAGWRRDTALALAPAPLQSLLSLDPVAAVPLPPTQPSLQPPHTLVTPLLPPAARSSEFAEQFHDAQGFGWAQVSPPVDVKKLIASKVRRGGGTRRVFVRRGAGEGVWRGVPCEARQDSGAAPGFQLHPSLHASPWCLPLAVLRVQAKEVERLNGVYGQILSKAGVEVIGARRRAAASPAARPARRPLPVRWRPRALCCAVRCRAAAAACEPLGPTPRCTCTLRHTHTHTHTHTPPAEGRGVVLDPHTVEVRAADGSVRQLKTKRILVATGGRAVKPPIPGAVRLGVLLGGLQGRGAWESAVWAAGSADAAGLLCPCATEFNRLSN